MSNLLENITVIDFSHRLPGPLAGHLLAKLGARVIKVEDHKFKDAFLHGIFSEMDESFLHWYRALNESKELKRFDFSSEDEAKEIRKMTMEADAVIMGLPPKVQKKLNLTKESLQTEGSPKAVIEMAASKNIHSSMHDLNALALTGLLKLHTYGAKEDVLAPPFLPASGIAFGNKIALDLLAALLKAKKENKTVSHTSYLYESTEEIFGPFWPKEDRENGEYKFLHNGKFPCYNLYRTKDGRYVALAAVEEKFWLRFCEVFNLSIPSHKRFQFKEPEVFNKISTKIKSLESKEIVEMTKDEDFCLNLV